jgi:hypothetical protein
MAEEDYKRQGTSSPIQGLAEQYVKLVLCMGELDSDFVDAYYGPEEWRGEAR